MRDFPMWRKPKIFVGERTTAEITFSHIIVGLRTAHPTAGATA